MLKNVDSEEKDLNNVYILGNVFLNSRWVIRDINAISTMIKTVDDKVKGKYSTTKIIRSSCFLTSKQGD